jgi:hypothetical protein
VDGPVPSLVEVLHKEPVIAGELGWFLLSLVRSIYAFGLPGIPWVSRDFDQTYFQSGEFLVTRKSSMDMKFDLTFVRAGANPRKSEPRMSEGVSS